MAVATPSPASEARIEASTANAIATEASIAEDAARSENAAVARAQDAVAAAERTAEEIALAAMQTEIGRQNAALRGEYETWRDGHHVEHQGLADQISRLTAELNSQATQIAECLARLPPPAEPSSTLVISEPATTGNETAVVIAPAENPVPIAESPAAPVARRKPRLI